MKECALIQVQICNRESWEMPVSVVLFILQFCNCLELSGFNNVKLWTVLFLFHVRLI